MKTGMISCDYFHMHPISSSFPIEGVKSPFGVIPNTTINAES